MTGLAAVGAHPAMAADPSLVWSGTASFGTLNPGSSSAQQLTLTNTGGTASAGLTISFSCPSASCDSFVLISAGPGEPLDLPLHVAASHALGRTLAFFFSRPRKES